jgi:hypothetical protein
VGLYFLVVGNFGAAFHAVELWLRYLEMTTSLMSIVIPFGSFVLRHRSARVVGMLVVPAVSGALMLDCLVASSSTVLHGRGNPSRRIHGDGVVFTAEDRALSSEPWAVGACFRCRGVASYLEASIGRDFDPGAQLRRRGSATRVIRKRYIVGGKRWYLFGRSSRRSWRCLLEFALRTTAGRRRGR